MMDCSLKTFQNTSFIMQSFSNDLIVNLDLRKAHLASILPWLRGVSILASVTCVKIVERVDVDCENIDYISVICVKIVLCIL